MRKIQQILIPTALALASCLVIVAQPPQGKGGPGGGGGKGGGKGGFGGGPALSVTSTAFPDGGEIPLKNAGVGGENKLPDFTFNWSTAGNPVPAPMTLQTYAVIFHDIENATAKGPGDTLHWSAFNIPGTAKGLPEGMGGGDLPDGTRNGPGIGAGRGMPAYFGPGAGPGPFHHYVFEFYALDTKLDLPATTTREEIMKAMEGHVIGKAAYVGRFHRTAQ
jgi:Raf kinase inhibitor-like YbhB/YbcL family protein